MKKIVLFALMAMSLYGAGYSVGQVVPPLSLKDQFGHTIELTTMPKTVIMAFEKGTAATVNEYLATQNNNYLAQNSAVFIADISQMPSFIATTFALPKLRSYHHPILLIEDEAQGLAFPGKEEKITILHFNQNRVSAIEFISTTTELKKAIEP
jgi:cyanate permease